MNSNMKKLLALALSLLMCASLLVPAFASEVYSDDAFTTIVTGSDFQDLGTKAFDRFTRVLSVMKADGLPTPDSVLVGGDYTKVLLDDAIPGITQIKNNYLSLYPDADETRVICIQGNHDNPSAGFTKTGLYDMGTYNLYVINEDDFPWNSQLKINTGVEKTAKNVESALSALIENGDTRPVIILTHVPMHYSTRSGGKDNKDAALLFNVINAAAEKLDIVFLFGHNHSKAYDDYIGGSVNLLKEGEEILIPDGKGGYTAETLNFTYANCGYIGYSNNTLSDTSTNVLTLGVIRIGEDHIRLAKYTEDGLYRVDDIQRKTTSDANGVSSHEEQTAMRNYPLWVKARMLFEFIFNILLSFFPATAC